MAYVQKSRLLTVLACVFGFVGYLIAQIVSVFIIIAVIGKIGKQELIALISSKSTVELILYGLGINIVYALIVVIVTNICAYLILFPFINRIDTLFLSFIWAIGAVGLNISFLIRHPEWLPDSLAAIIGLVIYAATIFFAFRFFSRDG